jgi:hypothetical protein
MSKLGNADTAPVYKRAMRKAPYKMNLVIKYQTFLKCVTFLAKKPYFRSHPIIFQTDLRYGLGIRVIMFDSRQNLFPFHHRVQTSFVASAVSNTIRMWGTVPAGALNMFAEGVTY